MPSDQITNGKLYDALTSMRLELKSDIGDLRRQFETLEAGRLTRLEAKMSDFEIAQTKRDSALNTAQSTLSGKVLIIWSMIGVVGVAFITALAYRLLVGTTK